MSNWLDPLHKNGILDALDLEFARFMSELAGDSSQELLLGCALASRVAAKRAGCSLAGEVLRR